MASTRYSPIHTNAHDPEAADGPHEDEVKPLTHNAPWRQFPKRARHLWPAWTDYKMLVGLVCMGALVVMLTVLVFGARRRNDCKAAAAPDFQLLVDWDHLPRSVNVTNGSHGVVASDQSRCSRIGAKVMQEGGNAIDAAVATILCLGVVNPIASGIGGGMLMTIQLSNGTAKVINAREVAPSTATADMYEGPGKKDASRVGGLAVGVPLELKGLWHAHQMYGKLEWARLVAPAAKLAAGGFEAHPYLVYVMSLPFSVKQIKASRSLRSIFLKPCGYGWRVPRVGERCCARPKLAEFLTKVGAVKSNTDFYKLYNATAEKWAAEVQEENGIITAADIKKAEPRVEEPLTIDIKPLGLRFVAPKPPSSAATLLMALKVLAGYKDMKDDLPRSYVRLVEALKHAFAVKLFLGDGGYPPLSNNITQILDMIDKPKYIDAVRKLILDDKVQALSDYGASLPALACGKLTRPHEHGTSQISIVDKDGNAVSATTTVNFVFGAKFLSSSTQVVFNNQMDDFFKPGTDSYGRRRLMGAENEAMAAACAMLGGHPNGIAPGKKPLSSMSPTIVSDPVAKHIVMVTGASGGPLIIGATLQSLFRVLVLKQSPWEAVSNPRVFNELFDGGVPPNCTDCDFTHYENFTMGHVQYQLGADVRQRLTDTHHNLSHHADYSEGVSQAVVSGSYLGWEGVQYVGVSDPRKDGAPYTFHQ